MPPTSAMVRLASVGTVLRLRTTIACAPPLAKNCCTAYDNSLSDGQAAEATFEIREAVDGSRGRVQARRGVADEGGNRRRDADDRVHAARQFLDVNARCRELHRRPPLEVGQGRSPCPRVPRAPRIIARDLSCRKRFRPPCHRGTRRGEPSAQGGENGKTNARNEISSRMAMPPGHARAVLHRGSNLTCISSYANQICLNS